MVDAVSAAPFVERLAQADEKKGLVIAREVLRALRTADAPFRYQLAVLLEERQLLKWAAFFAESILERVDSPSEEALWRALDAWASFVATDYPHSEEQALKVANMTLGTTPIDRGAKTRALTMLAYTRDVAGDHGAASAWYLQALEWALPHQRAGLLLDLGTSLSKQGRWDEALVSFDNSVAALPDAGDPRATRLRAQNLSRRAVVFEVMGNPEHAVALQHEAIDLARSIPDREGAFSASLRLVRHLVALRRYDDALAALEGVSDLEQTERNGRLYVVHDRARVLRARGAWADARNAYTKAIDLLPGAARELVRGNLDIWLEITAGIADVLGQLGDESLAGMATRAHHAASTLASARGIYRGESVERARLADRAATVADELRTALRTEGIDRAETPLFIIDFGAGTLTRRSTSVSVPLRAADIALLRLLAARSGIGWVASEDVARALEKAGMSDDPKKVIYEMRKRLHVAPRDLVVGRSGPGSAYRLVR